MVLNKTEAGHNSSSDWYECPLCGKTRLTCSKTTLASSGETVAMDTISNTDDLFSEELTGNSYIPAW